MQTRTVGVEEELLLVDPATRAVTSRAQEVLSEDRGGGLDQELFRHQLETRTDPETDLARTMAAVVAQREAARSAAQARGLAVVASGSPPLGGDHPVVSPDDRYRDMVERFGQLARAAGITCGMHVHVAIDSPEEGVGCLDRMAPWLPVLLAISANSPFADGSDTGYASWRNQLWSRWPSAGPTEPFGSVAGYHLACERLIECGAARDRAMLYFDARLSEGQPTLEVRVLDVVTDVQDVGLLAALVRGLVETAATGWAADEPHLPWRCEELRAATWRAARFGLAGDLVHPVSREVRPARQVVTSLAELVDDRLRANGDWERVDAGLDRVRAGTGATRQRAALEASGRIEGVVDDLILRTQPPISATAAP